MYFLACSLFITVLVLKSFPHIHRFVYLNFQKSTEAFKYKDGAATSERINDLYPSPIKFFPCPN